MKKLLFLTAMFVASALGSNHYAQAQWMNNLNDNIFISQMSLPGAHDAATGEGFSSISAIGAAFAGKCQDKDIAGLWDAGVRVFDLRPTDDGDDCTINHGSLVTNTTLRAALTTINGRLSSNSSEFAIVLMRKEDGDASAWTTKVSAIINSYSNVMPFRQNLRLGDVRGKILVLSRDYFADGYKIDYWSDNTTRDVKSANGVDFVVQDYYQVEDTDAKSTAITNILTEARTNNSTNRMFINHTSGYTGTTGTNSNINSNANTCNTLAYNTINSYPGPTGIILMDYAGSSSYNGANLVSKIIAQNSNIATTSPSAPATGQYYVYNVERDMYITRSNDYATRGGFDKAGMAIAVNNAGDGTLTLVTNVNGISKGIFIDNGNGEKVYVDNTPTSWTFECIDATNQIYTLKNGSNYLQAKDGQTRLEAGALPSNNSAQWQFIPRNVREDLSVATSSNPVDVTYLIENQGFDWYNGEQRSWKNADNSNWRPGDGFCHNADASNNCAEVWNANFNIHQSYTGLPNGVYELRVQGYYRISEGNNSNYLISQMSAGNSDIQRTKYYINSTEAYLLPQLSATLPAAYADNSVDINGTTYRYPNGKGKASIAFREGYYENEPIQAIVTDGNLTIGMKLDNKNGEDWNCFDNFRLYYLGLPDISQFTNALEAAIAAAQAFSGNTTTALQNALNAALSEAIAARTSVDTDVLTAKTNALNAARANAEAADVTFLSATIPLAQADGVDVTSANDVLVNGTSAEQVNNALAALRLARRKANAETHADVFTGNAPAAGDYYLYNVGTNRFFCGGADWGAHAALGFPGILVTLEETGTDGIYKINTHLKNGDDNGNPKYYLNCGGYCDTWTSDSWKFNEISSGIYNIVRSSNEANLLGYESATYNNVITSCITTTSSTNQWKLVTKADRDALLATATADAPQDASYLIKSPNFSQREDVSAWSMTGGAEIWGRGGNHPDFAVEAYNKTAAGVEQTVTGLPAGTYELKVQAFYRDGNFAKQAEILAGGGAARQLATLYAGSKSALIQNVYGGADQAPGIGSSSSVGYMPDGIDDACLYFQSGLYWATLDEIVVGQDGTMTIGARKTEKVNDGDWMVLDNFRLIYKGAGIDLTGVKADLLAKIEEANGILTDLGLNLSYLATAVANGQDAYENSTDADEIVNATNALVSAINATESVITDLTVFKQTAVLATAEGVVSGALAAVEAVTDASALGSVVSTQLNNLRTARRLNAVDKQPDVFTGSAPEDGGQYYIYNIGAQRYLTGGVDYGTHAAVNFAAQIATFTQNGDGWRIHTNIRTGSDALNHNGYVDCGGDGETWYLIQVSEGIYNISKENSNTGATLLGYSGERRGNWWQVDTDNQGAELAINQWKFVSKAERDALLATATPENPIDATYYIHAAGFDHHLPDAQMAFPLTQWQTWFPDGKGGNNGIGGWEPDYNWESWNSGNIKFYQTLSGLPAGKYRLSVQGYYRHGTYEQAVSEFNNPKTDGAILYATNGNNETFQNYLVPITSEVDKAPGYGRKGDVGSFPDDRNETVAQFFEFGLYKNAVNEVIVGTDGTLTIGVEKFENNQASEWVVVDNFRLTCLGLTPSTDVTIGTANYTTFVAPFNISEMPEGVEAYACQVGTNSVHLEPVTAIPAGEAVVLKNTGTYKFYSTAETVELGTTNDLLASDGTVQGGETIYALANRTNGVGFYPVSSSIYVPAGRGYLDMSGKLVKAFYGFDEDDATGIENLNVNANDNLNEGAVYDLSGRRLSPVTSHLSPLKKGIYIVNGKMTIVK